ncbi:hypothetical protein Tco_1168915 [Tanacetum coccineum]
MGFWGFPQRLCGLENLQILDISRQHISGNYSQMLQRLDKSMAEKNNVAFLGNRNVGWNEPGYLQENSSRYRKIKMVGFSRSVEESSDWWHPGKPFTVDQSWGAGPFKQQLVREDTSSTQLQCFDNSSVTID